VIQNDKLKYKINDVYELALLVVVLATQLAAYSNKCCLELPCIRTVYVCVYKLDGKQSGCDYQSCYSANHKSMEKIVLLIFRTVNGLSAFN